jgi:hypothetical protein
MMIFGFGRGPKTTPQFKEKGVSITIGFLATTPIKNGAPLSEQACERLEREIAAQLKMGSRTSED